MMVENCLCIAQNYPTSSFLERRRSEINMIVEDILRHMLNTVLSHTSFSERRRSEITIMVADFSLTCLTMQMRALIQHPVQHVQHPLQCH